MAIVKIATFSFYHHSDVPPWKREAPSEAEAMRLALYDLVCEDVPLETCEAALAAAKAAPAGEHTFSVEVDGEPDDLVVWHKQDDRPGPGGDRTNFGVGQGRSVADTDRSENIWIRLEEHDTTAREAVLAKIMPPEELARLLARAELLLA